MTHKNFSMILTGLKPATIEMQGQVSSQCTNPTSEINLKQFLFEFRKSIRVLEKLFIPSGRLAKVARWQLLHGVCAKAYFILEKKIRSKQIKRLNHFSFTRYFIIFKI